jgi:hypothetical protein
MFRYQGAHLVNYAGKVLDVYQGKDTEGQAVISWTKHTGLNQKWKVVYVDQAPKGPTKGMNKEFGFYIERPFVMISQLPAHRFLETVSATHVKITDPVNPPKKAQQFVFDQKSKTIRSNQWARYLAIQGDGAGSPAIVTPTLTSRWW